MAQVEQTEWIDAGHSDAFVADKPAVVRHKSLQIAVFRDEQGALHAVDNRCPHEGYPLSAGQVRGCTLTCAWHNFKFDLRDGACLKGDEPVRHYPLRVRDATVQIDVAPVPSGPARARGLQRLQSTVVEYRLGQAARELTRLLDLGVSPQSLAVELAALDARRAEWGSTHTLAVACDTLAYFDRYTEHDAALPLMQAAQLAMESCVRQPERPCPDPIDPGDDPQAAGLRLRALVEAEELTQAEALLRGAVAKGWGRTELEPWLYGPTIDHFLSNGHGLIYQVKVFDLLETGGWIHAADLLAGHLVGMVNATRQDTLPKWAWAQTTIAALEPRYAGWWQANAQICPSQTCGATEQAWLQALVLGKRDQAMAALVEALDAGIGFDAICDLLVRAASERLLRFESSHDGSVEVNEGWLDVTHTLTTASALRHALKRYRSPDILRLVLLVGYYIYHQGALDSAELGRHWREPLPPAKDDFSADEVQAAVAVGDVASALTGAAAVVRAGGEPLSQLRNFAYDLPLRDQLSRPIVVAHALKLAVVAFDEAKRLPPQWAAAPVQALMRLLAVGLRQRGVAQLCFEAKRLVVEGKVPRALT